MAVTDRDIGWLVEKAVRLREDTPGCKPWDRQGTAVIFARELKGKHLRTVDELVTAHACDPAAKTPASITRPFTPDAQAPPPAYPEPKAAECCKYGCGKHVDYCVCPDGPHTTPRPYVDPTPGAAAARAHIQQLRAGRPGGPE